MSICAHPLPIGKSPVLNGYGLVDVIVFGLTYCHLFVGLALDWYYISELVKDWQWIGIVALDWQIGIALVLYFLICVRLMDWSRIVGLA